MEYEQFSYRRGNLQLRSCDIHLMHQGVHTCAEIVVWCPDGSSEYCCTIARFDPSRECAPDFISVADRIIKDNVNLYRLKHLVETYYKIHEVQKLLKDQ